MKFLDKFKDVLHEDEKIVDSSCVNKKTFILKSILIPLALFFVVTIILILVAIINPVHYVEEKIVGSSPIPIPGHFEGFPWWVVFLVSGILLVVVLLICLFAYKLAKNYYICLTNKRIITRHGLFTTNYSYYAIDNVSGNITTKCIQSIFEKNEKSCSLSINIELLPVGHGKLDILTPSIMNGFEFSKNIDKIIKINSKQKSNSIKE